MGASSKARRSAMIGVMYILHRLPEGFAPRSTVPVWNCGTLIHHALYLKCREKAAREASPTAFIDSQSVKSAEKGGLASTATASMPAS